MHAGYPLISQDKLISIIYKEKSHISYKRGMHTLGASAAVAENTKQYHSVINTAIHR
jgi:hypothetical protein